MWRRLGRVPENRPAAETWVKPDKFDAVTLDHVAIGRELARAPKETVPGFVVSDLELSLPMPEGTTQRFRIVESSVMAPELAAKYPEIKTYAGQGIDDPLATVRLDLTPAGFHAQILSPRGAVYIDPCFRDKSVYTSYYKRDYRRQADRFRCLVESAQTAGIDRDSATDLARSGGNLRTYRLACAANAEYTAFHGGTVAGGLAGVVSAVNRITGIYETELAIRLVLVANNNLIIYTNSASDPYDNTPNSTVLSQNQANLTTVIGTTNYDIGHVFATGDGGVASLGVVCVAGSKARGTTGYPSPTGDAFWIDYVAHEMGHQFGANHTFNSTTGNCGGVNRNGGTAYEPGSGSTIMAYAGICGSDDLQPHSDAYFHSISFDEIIASIDGDCAVMTSTGNTAPTVNAGANYTIPASTPFILTATGSDPNGDTLTYCWEERDLGPATTLTAADNGSSPLFRVFNPTTNTWRTFPKLSDILNNATTLGEKLPTTSRTMNFRVTARDNRAGGGGVNTDDMSVTVVSSAGPFAVTSQPGGGTFSNAITVTWNVANTTASPINCANVTISLSTNGGQSFPITLAASTPNDGSQVVVLPNLNTAQARLKVQGAGNIFFDINGANFGIVPGVPTPLVTIDSFAVTAEGCAPGNGAIDPGETVTVSVGLRNVGSANTTNLVATLLSGGGVTVPSSAQAYGALIAGGGVVMHSYTFTATGACAGALSATLQLQDGPTSLGFAAQNESLGGFTNTSYSFTNSATVLIPASGNRGKGGPYPSTISVGGVSGTVSRVTVTLVGAGHEYSDDLDILLVGPGGQKVMLLSDAGGGLTSSGLTMTFDDAAPATAPDTAALTSGTFKPTDFDTASDAFSSPAPGSPYGTSLAVLNGVNPNGTWSLYTQDDQQQDTGALTGGWRLTINTMEGSCCSGAIVNNPPNFPAIPGKQVAESQTLVFTNTATDPDGNALSFSLVGAPTNASIAAATGVFTWTPTEAQGPATNILQVIVTDNGTPNLSATQSVTIVVTEINSSPTLTPISNKTVAEGGSVNFTNTATDGDLPANGLTFTLLQGPVGAAVHPTTGVFSWATTESDGPGTNLMFVVVTDNGTPNLSATQSLTIVVSESNDAPVLTPINNVTVVEGGSVNFTNTATDGDLPANGLTFTLLQGPGGAVVHPTTGEFSWTTGESDGPGTNLISIVVADNGSPSLSSTQTFTAIVLESNLPPVFPAIQSRVVHAGAVVTFTNSATDPDLPANSLTFSLDPGGPLGATVSPTGVFTWLTSDADANTTNQFTARVTDNGVPALEATQNFSVTVQPRPMLTSISAASDMVTLTWSAISGESYQLQSLQDVASTNWTDVGSSVLASGDSASQTNALDAQLRYFRVRWVVP